MKLSSPAPTIAAGMLATTMIQAIFSSSVPIERRPTLRNHATR